MVSLLPSHGGDGKLRLWEVRERAQTTDPVERSEDLNPHLPASDCCLQPGAGTLTVFRDC